MKLLFTLSALAFAATAQTAPSLNTAPVPTTLVRSLRSRAPAVNNATAPATTATPTSGNVLDDILLAAHPELSLLLNRPTTSLTPEQEGQENDEILASAFPALSALLTKKPSATETPEQVGLDNDEAILSLLSNKLSPPSAAQRIASDAPSAAVVPNDEASSSSLGGGKPSTTQEDGILGGLLGGGLSDPSDILAHTPKGELPEILEPIVDALPDVVQKFIRDLFMAAQDGLKPAQVIADGLITAAEQGSLTVALILKGVEHSGLGELLGGIDGPVGSATDVLQNGVADVGKLVSDLVHTLTGH